MRAITPSPWGARDWTQGFLNATQAPYQLDIPSPLLVSWLKREMGRREPCLHLVHKGSSEMLHRSWWWEGMHSVISSPPRNPDTRHISQLFQSRPTWHSSSCSYKVWFSSHGHSSRLRESPCRKYISLPFPVQSQRTQGLLPLPLILPFFVNHKMHA